MKTRKACFLAWAAAIEGNLKLNWLGVIIQKYVSRNDTVLDLGCGIMQATTNIPVRISGKKSIFKNDFDRSLICKSILGCDIWDKYLDITKNFFPVIKLQMDELDKFIDNSYDIIICLDVLEHIEFDQAVKAIEHMKRIARKKVIIYTPSKFITNEDNSKNAWGLGKNTNQIHKCFLPPERLNEFGFSISFPKPDENTLAVYRK